MTDRIAELATYGDIPVWRRRELLRMLPAIPRTPGPSDYVFDAYYRRGGKRLRLRAPEPAATADAPVLMIEASQK